MLVEDGGPYILDRFDPCNGHMDIEEIDLAEQDEYWNMLEVEESWQ